MRKITRVNQSIHKAKKDRVQNRAQDRVQCKNKIAENDMYIGLDDIVDLFNSACNDVTKHDAATQTDETEPTLSPNSHRTIIVNENIGKIKTVEKIPICPTKKFTFQFHTNTVSFHNMNQRLNTHNASKV